ncbi:hypothetical protein NP233_g359 [Leucocoprinus birnbaumii]|uniref:Uncharacterized protein n=1 Tax=Leucocoprinus birnbaumii TaxID=56174 RepID=A0AAD5W3W2_9AGAR|nr:hypothetical protein NP233_g359 [Leucocoprinus birnbaumii]
MAKLVTLLWETSVRNIDVDLRASVLTATQHNQSSGSQTQNPGLVRLIPSSDIDESLAKKLLAPIPAQKSLPEEFAGGAPRSLLRFTSSHQQDRTYSLDRDEVLTAAIWIGKAERTALAWLATSGADDNKIGAFSIAYQQRSGNQTEKFTTVKG